MSHTGNLVEQSYTATFTSRTQDCQADVIMTHARGCHTLAAEQLEAIQQGKDAQPVHAVPMSGHIAISTTLTMPRPRSLVQLSLTPAA